MTNSTFVLLLVSVLSIPMPSLAGSPSCESIFRIANQQATIDPKVIDELALFWISQDESNNPLQRTLLEGRIQSLAKDLALLPSDLEIMIRARVAVLLEKKEDRSRVMDQQKEKEKSKTEILSGLDVNMPTLGPKLILWDRVNDFEHLKIARPHARFDSIHGLNRSAFAMSHTEPEARRKWAYNNLGQSGVMETADGHYIAVRGQPQKAHQLLPTRYTGTRIFDVRKQAEIPGYNPKQGVLVESDNLFAEFAFGRTRVYDFVAKKSLGIFSGMPLSIENSITRTHAILQEVNALMFPAQSYVLHHQVLGKVRLGTRVLMSPRGTRLAYLDRGGQLHVLDLEKGIEIPLPQGEEKWTERLPQQGDLQVGTTWTEYIHDPVSRQTRTGRFLNIEDMALTNAQAFGHSTIVNGQYTIEKHSVQRATVQTTFRLTERSTGRVVEIPGEVKDFKLNSANTFLAARVVDTVYRAELHLVNLTNMTSMHLPIDPAGFSGVEWLVGVKTDSGNSQSAVVFVSALTGQVIESEFRAEFGVKPDVTPLGLHGAAWIDSLSDDGALWMAVPVVSQNRVRIEKVADHQGMRSQVLADRRSVIFVEDGKVVLKQISEEPAK